MSQTSSARAISYKQGCLGVVVFATVLVITVFSRFLDSSVFSRLTTDINTDQSVVVGPPNSSCPELSPHPQGAVSVNKTACCPELSPHLQGAVSVKKTACCPELSPHLQGAVSVNKTACCPELSPHLQGAVSVNKTALSWSDLPSSLPPLSPGGRHTVTECRSRHHVAIVIPYRDRDEHLRLFLRHMIPLFVKQQLDFGIYVVDQRPGSSFNRGILMNIGFVEALKVANYSCFVFSDIDLLLENDKNVYGCPATPRHLSVAIDKHKYRLPYAKIFGGVENFRTEHFRRINGFSNKYFAWGGEDNDLYRRVVRKGLKLSRPLKTVARYTMSVHKKQAKNPRRLAYLKKARARQDKDGLNSLVYDVISRQINSLYTNISVTIDQKYILEH